MFANKRFSFALLLAVAISLFIKLSVAASVLRPTDETIAQAVTGPLREKGYLIAGLSSFAGRASILAAKDDCQFYFVPVSPQGWHDETVRLGLSDDQRLVFVYDGRMYEDHSPWFYPVFSYYSGLLLTYLGVDHGYDPVYAVVTSGKCTAKSPDWNGFQRVSFRVETIFTAIDNSSDQL